MTHTSTKPGTLDTDLFLTRLGTEYERELLRESAIDPAVAMERGYLALMRPNGDGNYDNSPMPGKDSREFLNALGFPSWSTREPYYYPGLWIPGWDVQGRRTPGQWKPKNPVPNRDGKRMKYAGAKGSATRLDVHPRWTRDRGQDDPSLVPAIRDVAVPLWITEGIKKADSLTSREVCTIGLTGVYNWRNSLGTLGDWEDVTLRGREVTICFDADALVKPAVAQAMERLGRWMRSRGVAKVWYLVVPGEVNGSAVKGVDDYFAAGGTLKALEQARTSKPPAVRDTADAFSDAKLAETIAAEVLDGQYIFIPGERAGRWLGWNGHRWADVSDVVVGEAVRVWALDRFREAAEKLTATLDPGVAAAVDGFRTLLSASRQRTVLSLAKGIPYIMRTVRELDTDPDLLNTPSGVVDLRTGELLPHDPSRLMTKVCGVAYNPDADLSVWERGLAGVLPADVLQWFQRRMGQAATGHQSDDGRMLLLTGDGNNGKTMVMGAIFRALGGHEFGSGYAVKVPNTLLLKGSNKGAATPEKMTLLGCRYAYIEETPEESYLNGEEVKALMDAEAIEGRKLYEGFVSFAPSHSIFLNTNHPPIVSGTDNGTWRRLARVDFPLSFIPQGKPLTKPHHRRADPRIKVAMGTPAVQEAALRWLVAGAVSWYASGQVPQGSEPASVTEAILTWRHQSDTLLRFLDEKCEFAQDACVSSSVLHAEFERWAKASGHKGMSNKLFTDRLVQHSGLPSRVEWRRGVRFAAVAGFSMPPIDPSVWASERTKRPEQGAAWFGIRFREHPDQ